MSALAPVLHNKSKKLLRAFLSGRSQNTLRSYRSDLEDFAGFIADFDLQKAVSVLVTSPPGDANLIGLNYRTHLINIGLAPATINRRLASLRSLVRLAKTIGVVTWTLEVSNVKSQAYRDTRGPEVDGFGAMLAELDKKRTAKNIRDKSINRLLHDLSLRVSEVCGLDLIDYDREAGTISIIGKGRTEKEILTLPAKTKKALENWINVRGDQAGALFTNFDRAKQGRGRLTSRGIHKIVSTLGAKVGIKTWPHGLRHLGITTALDKTNGNTRAVQKYSRHKDIRTLGIYDDNRTDMAGQIAEMVAESTV